MKHRFTLAVGGALGALAIAPVAPAVAAAGTRVKAPAVAAAGTPVTVRVEGVKRTLLQTTTVRSVPLGSITKGGTPRGACPEATAAGALEVATHGRWGGTYTSSLGLELTSILGESHPFSSRRYYWSIWVDNRFATAGICGLRLHRGEQLLFAAVPQSGTTYPIVLSAPGRARVGHAFRLRAFYYGAGNRLRPLVGLHVSGLRGTTNARGYLSATPRRAGRLVLSASRSGFIRSARITVRVLR